MARPRPVPRWPLVEKKGSKQRLRVSSSLPVPLSETSRATRVGIIRWPRRDVVAGGLDVRQIPSAALAEVGFVPEQQLGKAGDGREGVVDVVGDAAGQLAEGAEPFVLHDRLLRLAKFVVGALQLGVQTRLI